MTRDEFMDMVYSELHSDGDNYRANRIIDAADEYVETEKALDQEDVIDKIRAEIDRQEKWLLRAAGCNTYNVDIAFDAIKAVLVESEDKK